MQKVNFNEIKAVTNFKQNSKNVTNILKEEPTKEADFENFDKAAAVNAKAGIAFKGKFFIKKGSSFEKMKESALKAAEELKNKQIKTPEAIETAVKTEEKAVMAEPAGKILTKEETIVEKPVAENIIKEERTASAQPIIEEAGKIEEKAEEKAQNLYEDLITLREKPQTRPLLFEEQNEKGTKFYNLSNPKPISKLEMASPELRATLAQINQDAIQVKELGQKIMDEITHSPEYLQKRKEILDIYENKKYVGVMEEYELSHYPKEMIEAFKKGQREFSDVKRYGKGLIRVVSEKESDNLMNGSLLINNGKIKLEYSLGYNGNIGHICCHDTSQPIIEGKMPNIHIQTNPEGTKIDRIITTNRKNNVFEGSAEYEYSDYIPDYCVKRVTRDLPNDYHEAIAFTQSGEVQIGLPGATI